MRYARTWLLFFRRPLPNRHQYHRSRRLHHQLRLQRPMAARNHYRYLQYDSYEPFVQVRNSTIENGESRQRTHYFHCNQISIPREMTDKDGNLLWFGDYYGWGKLKSKTNISGTAHQPFRLQNQYADREMGLHYNFFWYYESVMRGGL